MTKQTAGDKVFQTLSFQYKPLENRLLKHATPEHKNWYKKLDNYKKIKVLDRYAQLLGL